MGHRSFMMVMIEYDLQSILKNHDHHNNQWAIRLILPSPSALILGFWFSF